MDATTTAVFASAGVTPSTLTNFLNTVFNQGISFMIYVFQTVWPYLLILGLISVIVGIAYGALRLARRA